MAKKTTKPKTKSVTKQSVNAKDDRIEPRKKLLARVAGSVAAGIVQAPSPSTSSAEGIATVAVDIAEQILRRADVASPPAQPSSSGPLPADVPGEAAS